MNKIRLTPRTNEDWIKQLSDPVDGAALLDLRNILLTGLRAALVNKISIELDLKSEDFTDRALVKIQKELPKYNGAGKFTTWALKIAIHLAFVDIRYERLRDNFLGSKFNLGTIDFSPPAVQQGQDGDLVLERINDSILTIVGDYFENELTDRQRTALLAIYQQGLSMEESALQLDMSPVVIDELLSNTRIRLRALITETLNLNESDVFTFFELSEKNPTDSNGHNPDKK